MAPTIKAFSTFTSSVASASVTINAPDGTQQDDLLILIHGEARTSGSPTIGLPSGGSTWNTLDSGYQYNSTQSVSAGSRVFWKFAGASEPASYTYTRNGSRCAAILLCISGANTALTPIKSLGNNDTPSSPATSVSVFNATPSTDHDLDIRLVVGGHWSSGTFASTPAAGYTQIGPLQDGTSYHPVVIAQWAALTSSTSPGTKTFSSLSPGFYAYTTLGIIVPASPVTNVSPSGISSAEAFGTTQVNLKALPSGIPSEETFGSTAVQYPQPLSPIGITSGEVVGTAQLNFLVNPPGIGSEEAFGTPFAGAGVSPSGIPSAEAVGAVTVIIQQILNPTGTPTGEAFGGPTVQVGYPLTLDVESAVSQEDFGIADVRLLQHLAFRPPSVREAAPIGDRLFSRVAIERGISVIRRADGTWYETRYPTTDEIEAAIAVYLGGRSYPITQQEADDLTAAGYGDHLEMEDNY